MILAPYVSCFINDIRTMVASLGEAESQPSAKCCSCSLSEFLCFSVKQHPCADDQKTDVVRSFRGCSKSHWNWQKAKCIPIRDLEAAASWPMLLVAPKKEGTGREIRGCTLRNPSSPARRSSGYVNFLRWREKYPFDFELRVRLRN